ncbi:MAG: hypothetical protein WC066_03965 [Candidatus Omnitrophota bacterium]
MACILRQPNELCLVFEYTAESALTAWTLYPINDVIVINKATAAIDDTAVLYYFVPKVIVDCIEITSGNLASFAEGSKVYYADNAVTSVANGDVCGFVTVQPAIGDTTVEIHFDGTLRIVA